jgi:hypothetical protein
MNYAEKMERESRLMGRIADWMEAHGIMVDDKNWNTVAKILQRSRAVYCPNRRLTGHKSSKHRRKTEVFSQPQSDFVHL